MNLVFVCVKVKRARLSQFVKLVLLLFQLLPPLDLLSGSIVLATDIHLPHITCHCLICRVLTNAQMRLMMFLGGLEVTFHVLHVSNDWKMGRKPSSRLIMAV